jgi:hypothetical protein
MTRGKKLQTGLLTFCCKGEQSNGAKTLKTGKVRRNVFKLGEVTGL